MNLGSLITILIFLILLLFLTVYLTYVGYKNENMAFNILGSISGLSFLHLKS